MAAVAETTNTTTHEVYAQSLNTVRALGRIALKESVLSSNEGVVEEAWQDFVTAAGENLATDPEYGEQLKFEPLRRFKIINGKTVDSKGVPLIELIRRGYQASLEASSVDPEMEIQAERDEGDVSVAETVDNLEIGELYAVVSLDPKEALKRNPRYWRGKGYREGMAVAQVYYRSGSGQVLAGAYSIKQSNKSALRRIFSKFDVHIPEDETDGRWIRHGIRIQATPEKAAEFGNYLQAEHSKEVGQNKKFISATTIIKDQESLVRQFFEGYIVPLAKSYASRTVDPKIKELALSLMNNGTDYYSSEERRTLIRLSNGMAPNDEDTRFMEEKIRYALVEELRKLIPGYLSESKPLITESKAVKDVPSYNHLYALAYQQANLSSLMAGNIARGLSAGRSYGGCSTAGRESDPGLDENNSPISSTQDVFGGKGEGESSGSEKLVWKKGVCRIDGCPTRPGQTEVAQCSVCRGCQKWFDKGRDPAKLYKGIKSVQRSSVTIDLEKRKETVFSLNNSNKDKGN